MPDWVIPAIVGPLILGVLLLVARVIMGSVFRWLIKPEVTVKPAVADTLEEASGPPLFPTRRVAIWIKSSDNVHVDSITFKRICRYQRHCLLFRFFVRVGVLRDRRWCHFANVNDFRFEARGFVEPSAEEKHAITLRLADEGELTLRPSVATMLGGRWIAVDVPFTLSCERPHALAVRLDYSVELRNRSATLRTLSGVVNFLRVKNSNVFRTARSVDIDWGGLMQKGHEPSANGGKIRESRSGEVGIGSWYGGLGRIDRARELTSSLGRCIGEYAATAPRPTETSAWEVMESIRQEIPDVHIAVSMPPDGVYLSVPMEATKELLGCWSFCRQFCDEFLGCTGYAGLCRYFAGYFAFFPQLLADSHAYLCLRGHSARIDLIGLLERRGEPGLPSLGKFAAEEWKFWCRSRKSCKVLRRRTDMQADVVVRLRRSGAGGKRERGTG